MIYLDHAATTTLSPHVREVMEPWLSVPANAGAKHHPYGAAAAGAVDKARAQVAGRIGAQPENIVFTSGATEANNLAIKGIAAHLKATGKTHIVTTAVEHKSVLAPLAALEGFTVSVLPVKPCGMIEAGMIEKALTAQTGLVCVQAVNNETGTIQPLSEIVAMLRGRGIFLHADAAQAVGKIDFNINESGADFAALSAHKVYGPQGIGALYVRGNVLTPLLHGGGQENGLRSGTLPVALCVGMGAAFKFAENRCAELQTQREVFLEKLAPLSPVIHGHRDPAWNVPGILNIRFPGIDNETLVMALPGLAFGVGSACSSAGNKHSHVIESITGSAQAAKESIRISWGGLTGMVELQNAADQIIATVTEIRQMQEAA